MRTGVDLRGFRELDRALGELPKATARNVLRRVARGALEPMANAAAAAAPEDTGKLAFSIEVSETRTRRAQPAKAEFLAPGVFRSARKNYVELAMGSAGGLRVLPYAAFVEFGTVDTPAQPYMRPAWDAGKDGALQHVRSELGSEIDKAAARIAAKAARKGV